MIGYWHDVVVCLSFGLSVTLCIVAKRCILQQKVSEQVNRKCPRRNTILLFKTSNPLQTTIRMAFWLVLAVGGAAQLAVAHFPNKRTLDPQCMVAWQTHHMPQLAALWPSPRRLMFCG